MTTVKELFTKCSHCPDWEVQVFSVEEKQRKEQAHAAAKHHSTDAITALLTDDPSHERDKRAIVAAIEVAARSNCGYVSANDVRPLLPSWVAPNMVGATFQGLIRVGRLIPTGDDVRNNDTRSRNTNKDAPIYYMPEAA